MITVALALIAIRAAPMPESHIDLCWTGNALVGCANGTLEAPEVSPDYRRGWCEAWALAADASHRNAAHLRVRIGALAKGKSSVSLTAATMLDAMDHFVVLAPVAGSAVHTPAGRFTCPPKP